MLGERKTIFKGIIFGACVGSLIGLICSTGASHFLSSPLPYYFYLIFSRLNFNWMLDWVDFIFAGYYAIIGMIVGGVMFKGKGKLLTNFFWCLVVLVILHYMVILLTIDIVIN